MLLKQIHSKIIDLKENILLIWFSDDSQVKKRRKIDFEENIEWVIWYYYPFQNRMHLTVNWITFDRNKIESCGFHHSKEKCWGYKYMANSIGQQ